MSQVVLDEDDGIVEIVWALLPGVWDETEPQPPFHELLEGSCDGFPTYVCLFDYREVKKAVDCLVEVGIWVAQNGEPRIGKILCDISFDVLRWITKIQSKGFDLTTECPEVPISPYTRAMASDLLRKHNLGRTLMKMWIECLKKRNGLERMWGKRDVEGYDYAMLIRWIIALNALPKLYPIK